MDYNYYRKSPARAFRIAPPTFWNISTFTLFLKLDQCTSQWTVVYNSLENYNGLTLNVQLTKHCHHFGPDIVGLKRC